MTDFLIEQFDGPVNALTFIIIALNMIAIRSIVRAMSRDGVTAEVMVPMIAGQLSTLVSSGLFAYILIAGHYKPSLLAPNTLLTWLYTVAALLALLKALTFLFWSRGARRPNVFLMRFINFVVGIG